MQQSVLLSLPLRFLGAGLAIVLMAGGGAADDRTGPPIREAVTITVRDATKRTLGTLELSRVEAADRSRASVYAGSGGRRLEAETVRTPYGRLTAFRDVASGEVLEIVNWGVFAVRGRTDLHVPEVLRVGKEAFYASFSNDPGSWKDRALSIGAQARAWLSLKAPKWAPLLEEAWRTARWAFRSPQAETILGTRADLRGEPLFQLGTFFDPAPAGEGVTIERMSMSPAVRGGLATVLAVSPREVRPFSLAVEGGRGEELGTLELKRLRGESPGTIGPLSLELRMHRTRDRLVVLEARAGIEVAAAFVRETDASRRNLARLSTLLGGKGETWFEPWIVENTEKSDKMLFEIPPSGDRDRRLAVARIAEALEAAVQSNTGSAEEGSRVLYRWQRLLEQPEVRAAGPAFERIQALLSELPPPQLEEPESAWRGAIRLRAEADRAAGR